MYFLRSWMNSKSQFKWNELKKNLNTILPKENATVSLDYHDQHQNSICCVNSSLNCAQLDCLYVCWLPAFFLALFLILCELLDKHTHGSTYFCVAKRTFFDYLHVYTPLYSLSQKWSFSKYINRQTNTKTASKTRKQHTNENLQVIPVY